MMGKFIVENEGIKAEIEILDEDLKGTDIERVIEILMKTTFLCITLAVIPFDKENTWRLYTILNEVIDKVDETTVERMRYAAPDLMREISSFQATSHLGVPMSFNRDHKN